MEGWGVDLLLKSYVQRVQMYIKISKFILTKMAIIKNLNQKEHQWFALSTKYKFSMKYNSGYQIFLLI